MITLYKGDDTAGQLGKKCIIRFHSDDAVDMEGVKVHFNLLNVVTKTFENVHDGDELEVFISHVDSKKLPLGIIHGKLWGEDSSGKLRTFANRIPFVITTNLCKVYGSDGLDSVDIHVYSSVEWDSIANKPSLFPSKVDMVEGLEEALAKAGKVKTVNGVEPDENGNIEIDIPTPEAPVNSVNGKTGDVVLSAGDVNAYSKSQTDAKVKTAYDDLNKEITYLRNKGDLGYNAWIVNGDLTADGAMFRTDSSKSATGTWQSQKHKLTIFDIGSSWMWVFTGDGHVSDLYTTDVGATELSCIIGTTQYNLKLHEDSIALASTIGSVVDDKLAEDKILNFAEEWESDRHYLPGWYVSYNGIIYRKNTNVQSFLPPPAGGLWINVYVMNEIHNKISAPTILEANDQYARGRAAEKVASEAFVESLGCQNAVDALSFFFPLLEEVYSKEQVDDKINEFAAHYLTKDSSGRPFATLEELTSATEFYYAGSAITPTKHDYCIILSDSAHNNSTTRYAYVGVYGDDGQWQYQYTINETSFSQVQWDAINSLVSRDEDGNLCYDGHIIVNSSGEFVLTETDPVFTAWKNEVQIILGSNASVASGKYKQIAIGSHATANGQNAIALGSSEPGGKTNGPKALAQNAIAIGAGAQATATNSIQIFAGTNDTSGTMKIGDKTVAFLTDIPISTADVNDFQYYKGHYDLATQYRTDDIVRAVSTEGETIAYFKALQDSKGVNPFTFEAYWERTEDDEGLDKLLIIAKASVASLTGAEISVSPSNGKKLDVAIAEKIGQGENALTGDILVKTSGNGFKIYSGTNYADSETSAGIVSNGTVFVHRKSDDRYIEINPSGIKVEDATHEEDIAIPMKSGTIALLSDVEPKRDKTDLSYETTDATIETSDGEKATLKKSNSQWIDPNDNRNVLFFSTRGGYWQLTYNATTYFMDGDGSETNLHLEDDDYGATADVIVGANDAIALKSQVPTVTDSVTENSKQAVSSGAVYEELSLHNGNGDAHPQLKANIMVEVAREISSPYLYGTSTSYNVGDYVSWDGKIYKVIKLITSATTILPPNAEYFKEVTALQEIPITAQDITDFLRTNIPELKFVDHEGDRAISQGTLFKCEGSYYRAKINIPLGVIDRDFWNSGNYYEYVSEGFTKLLRLFGSTNSSLVDTIAANAVIFLKYSNGKILRDGVEITKFSDLAAIVKTGRAVLQATATSASGSSPVLFRPHMINDGTGAQAANILFDATGTIDEGVYTRCIRAAIKAGTTDELMVQGDKQRERLAKYSDISAENATFKAAVTACFDNADTTQY